jgi:hypothetical protein
MAESASAFTDPRMADIDFVVWLCLLICCCGLRNPGRYLWRINLPEK